MPKMMEAAAEMARTAEVALLPQRGLAPMGRQSHLTGGYNGKARFIENTKQALFPI